MAIRNSGFNINLDYNHFLTGDVFDDIQKVVNNLDDITNLSDNIELINRIDANLTDILKSVAALENADNVLTQMETLKGEIIILRDECTALRDATQTSASNAAISETNAASSATASANSASAAAQSVIDAQAQVVLAQTEVVKAETARAAAEQAETNAETAETNAKVSENAASDSAQLARDWAIKDTEVITGEDSAKTHAGRASASEVSAQNGATVATNAAILAGEWANNPENSPVQGTNYSAYHWSEKAKQAAESVAHALLPMGPWDASSGNLPPTPSDTTQWEYYWVDMAGTLPSPIGSVVPGNQLIWNVNTSNWSVVRQTNAVNSVNGYTGVIVLDAADVDAVSTALTNPDPQVIKTDLAIDRAGFPRMELTADTVGNGGVFLRNSAITDDDNYRSIGVDSVLGPTVYSANHGDKKLYHEGNRPSPSDIGARPDTWTPSADDVGAYTKGEVDTKFTNLVDNDIDFQGELKEQGNRVVTDGNFDTKLLAEMIKYSVPEPDFWMPLTSDINIRNGFGTSTFSRSTTATYIDKSGVLRTAEIDEPRFEKEGILIEGESENRVSTSTTYQACASNSIPSPTPLNNSETAPDGTDTAWRLDPGCVGNSDRCQRNYSGNVTTTVMTVSCFMKSTLPGVVINFGAATALTPKAGAGTFDFDSRTFTSQGKNCVNSFTELADGWIRFEFRLTNPSGANVVETVGFMSAGVSEWKAPDLGLRVWGWQVETLPFASSYIPTSGSPATRAGDSLRVTQPFPNEQAHSFCLETHNMSPGLSYYPRILWADSNSGADQYHFRPKGDFTEYAVYTAGGVGATQGGIFTNGIHAFTISDTRSGKLFKDGALRADSTWSRTPKFSSGDLYIGCQGSISQIYGHIRNFRVWHQALTPEQVSTLGG